MKSRTPLIRQLVRANLIAVAVLTAIPLSAQEEAATQVAFDPADKRADARFPGLAWLEGEWRGYGEFTNRTTYIHKTWEFDVAGIFLTERTIDMFPPAEPSTEFEVHQDLTVFYWDGTTLKAKGFYVEGFVWNSLVSTTSEGHIVIETAEVENGPPGVKARYTIRPDGADAFTATFELAFGDKDYGLMETLTMRRVR